MYQVTLHGRGGQGVVTAAELIAAAAIGQGRYALAFPSFGSERTGAPVAAYCRIDDAPIRTREPIADPDAVVVLDATLLTLPSVLGGLRPDTTVLVNTAVDVPDGIRARHPVRFHPVPAAEAARARTGRPVPNAAMIGAFAAVTGAVTLDALRAALSERFAPHVAEANALAAADLYEYESALRGATGAGALTAQRGRREAPDV